MTTRRVLAGVVLVAALAACNNTDRPRSGVVTDKHIVVTMVCVGYIKGQCSNWAPVTSRKITLTSEGGSTGEWEVSSDEYAEILVGQHWQAMT